MKNVTVAIPTETWRVARLWCAQHNTTMSEMVSGILWHLPKYSEAVERQCKQVHQRELAREHDPSIRPLALKVSLLQPAAPKDAKNVCETVKPPLNASAISNVASQPPGCDGTVTGCETVKP